MDARTRFLSRFQAFGVVCLLLSAVAGALLMAAFGGRPARAGASPDRLLTQQEPRAADSVISGLVREGQGGGWIEFDGQIFRDQDVIQPELGSPLSYTGVVRITWQSACSDGPRRLWTAETEELQPWIAFETVTQFQNTVVYDCPIDVEDAERFTVDLDQGGLRFNIQDPLVNLTVDTLHASVDARGRNQFSVGQPGDDTSVITSYRGSLTVDSNSLNIDTIVLSGGEQVAADASGFNDINRIGPNLYLPAVTLGGQPGPQPTSTPFPPTETPVPPTVTPTLGPTDTPVPPTPTATPFPPTATPTKPPDNAIGNADFEMGHVIWIESATEGSAVITDDFSQTSIDPHSGSWAVWLGGTVNEQDSVEQAIAVPADAAILAWWGWVDSSQTTCGSDTFLVALGPKTGLIDLCLANNNSEWTLYGIEVGTLTDQMLDLFFGSTQDQAFLSNFYLDDIHFVMLSASPQLEKVVMVDVR